MANTFKTLLSSDIVNTRNFLHESVPITGTIVSGTYNNAADGSEYNIKNYAHGQFQSVYDYPYLSSSANHLFDITVGYSSRCTTEDFSTETALATLDGQKTKKNNMYDQMAQLLNGYDESGSIKAFTNPVTGQSMKQCIFLPFSRLLVKDEIKKGSFSLSLYTTGSANNAAEFAGAGPIGAINGTPPFGAVTFSDSSGSSGYYTDSPAGEYGVLFDDVTSEPNQNAANGLLFYQAGIAVLTASIFNSGSCGNNNGANLSGSIGEASSVQFAGGRVTDHMFMSGTIENFADAIRHRFKNVSFNNTTELNSTIYFCRANSNEFNYSSNPTYLSESEIRVKTNPSDQPISYITTVGLYGADNELLAVAKLSEPLKKTNTNELTLRVRLDY
tara:strand:+ start:892 stop:2052 length:1161 start_codon:yes stop_codon:yes gene_type:complete